MFTKKAVILAAGEGTRMKSKKPKALTQVLFKPMLDWVIDALISSGIENICIVKGSGADYIDEHLQNKYPTVLQSVRLGTGHAVYMAKDFISDEGDVLVLNGDAPFIDSDTINNAYSLHKKNENSVTVISAYLCNPTGYGRIIRNADSTLDRIVEQKDGTPEELAVNEVNSGAYWFNAKELVESLDVLSRRFESGESGTKEFYLTDTVYEMKKRGLNAGSYMAENSDIVLGANDRVQLLDLNEKARKNELNRQMRAGVSIPCSDGVIICVGAKIGTDTIIMPNTTIKGDSVIGENCIIGPSSHVEGSIIGDNVSFSNSVCYDAKICDNADIGPFVRIRPNTVINENVHVGNFVEIKNSSIGRDTKISHLSYIGDSDFGENINVGCGCATANYSGNTKSRTTVEDGAFLGCHTCLVAPVKVGENAYTAAGSTITEDVDKNALAIARTRQRSKAGWVEIKQPYKRKV